MNIKEAGKVLNFMNDGHSISVEIFTVVKLLF